MCGFCARKRQNSCCGPGTPARDSPVARFDSRKSALSLAFDPSEISRRFPTARLRGFPGESRKKISILRFVTQENVSIHGSADPTAAESRAASHGPNLGFDPVRGRSRPIDGRSLDRGFRVRKRVFDRARAVGRRLRSADPVSEMFGSPRRSFLIRGPKCISLFFSRGPDRLSSGRNHRVVRAAGRASVLGRDPPRGSGRGYTRSRGERGARDGVLGGARTPARVSVRTLPDVRRRRRGDGALARFAPRHTPRPRDETSHPLACASNSARPRGPLPLLPPRD